MYVKSKNLLQVSYASLALGLTVSFLNSLVEEADVLPGDTLETRSELVDGVVAEGSLAFGPVGAGTPSLGLVVHVLLVEDDELLEIEETILVCVSGIEVGLQLLHLGFDVLLDFVPLHVLLNSSRVHLLQFWEHDSVEVRFHGDTSVIDGGDSLALIV